MANLPEWEDYKRFVAQLSWKSYRRAKSSGLAVDFDDIFQEASMAYVRAAQKFNPNLGFKFITYCGAAVMSALAQHKRQLDKQLVGKTVSLDSMLGDDEDAYDIFPNHAADPMQELVFDGEFQLAMSKLGPIGELVIEWLINPPPEVEAELGAYKWKLCEMQRRGMRRNQSHIEMDVRFLVGELLPRLMPNKRAALTELRAKVQDTVQAWQI